MIAFARDLFEAWFILSHFQARCSLMLDCLIPLELLRNTASSNAAVGNSIGFGYCREPFPKKHLEEA